MLSTQFQRIGIACRIATPEAFGPVSKIVQTLLDDGLEVYLDEDNYHDLAQMPQIEHCQIVSKSDLGRHCHVVMVLGGDGTFLSVARKIAPFYVPIIGINLGRLGFLTQVPVETLATDLRNILSGKYLPEDLILLESKVVRDDKTIKQSLALNDVVLSRGGLGQMVEFEVFINRQFVYTQRSDGLIVSTPTGSTAYSLAAGGPILQSSMHALALVPICPQSMTNRPIVISDTSEIEIMLTKGMDARVHFDGQSFIDLQKLDRIIIRRYRNTLRVLHPTDYHYYRTLRTKLHWGEQLV
ncbi:MULTISPECIES: NAD(+) kinase [Vitreoscilla]|uniref:NAD kinase n=1 Tax=Vitreoscilla stercoraria TaxID=61 RepID=A0ABY4EE72_VITST|nr:MULTISPECIES: NAD(+) kinase [Vitreoscilla]AUZ04578.1 putative inorganic polyphosphate/ATP-NAD kinase [Vitreoscilla sp. C1]UOO91722.1 NAD(+) kinase [Vitreoscilla stercoraria]